MKEPLIKFRNTILRVSYRQILKPILFKMDPERVHNTFSFFGILMGSNPFTRALTRLLFDYSRPLLESKILGIHFKNPIGLSAGFDKNARLTKIMPCVGFGFMEVGSITGEPCEGNPKPRLWRHPELKSIRVSYGLLNDGCKAIAKRLTGKQFSIPIGISVAKSNNLATCELEAGILDYAKAFKVMKDCGLTSPSTSAAPIPLAVNLSQTHLNSKLLQKLIEFLAKTYLSKIVSRP